MIILAVFVNFLSCIFFIAISSNKALAAPKATPAINGGNNPNNSGNNFTKNNSMNTNNVNSTYKNIFTVRDKMSKRFRSDVIIDDNNVKDFANDLNNVLLAENDFPTNDLSLYYLIDKTHNVGSDYVPNGITKLTQNNDFNINRNDLSLRPDVLVALTKMAHAARSDGVTLLVSSTYRSYNYQKALFDRWVKIDGLEEAERESAHAGTSQHQLGSAIDFGSISDDFADTKMGRWMYKNASIYGWSLSFPKGYEDVTGYRWESWHFRYIGPVACQMQQKWFCNVQQYMFEFIDEYKKITK